MREISADDITKTIARLCQEANFDLGEDVLDALKRARDKEESPLGQQVLEQIKSIVRQPYSSRINTKDNTPAVIHMEMVKGDRLHITVMPKGGGSENMSRLAMLTPAKGRQGVIDFVVNSVAEAGSNPCPPVIIGVGIGGTADKAMILAKKALLRQVGEPNPDPEIAELEQEVLERVNSLGIGPQGFGGRTTALAVHAEVFPTHIAMMPAAVNLQCHAARHKEAVL